MIAPVLPFQRQAVTGVPPVLPRRGPGRVRFPGQNAPHLAHVVISASPCRCVCAGDGTCCRNGGTVCPQSEGTKHHESQSNGYRFTRG